MIESGEDEEEAQDNEEQDEEILEAQELAEVAEVWANIVRFGDWEYVEHVDLDNFLSMFTSPKGTRLAGWLHLHLIEATDASGSLEWRFESLSES